MLVVGSRNSSNSVRLVEVALDAGSDAAYLVDYADDIDPAWLDGVTHGRRDLRRVGARDPGARRARAAGRVRLRRPCSRSRPPTRRWSSRCRARSVLPVADRRVRRRTPTIRPPTKCGRRSRLATLFTFVAPPGSARGRSDDGFRCEARIRGAAVRWCRAARRSTPRTVRSRRGGSAGRAARGSRPPSVAAFAGFARRRAPGPTAGLGGSDVGSDVRRAGRGRRGRSATGSMIRFPAGDVPATACRGRWSAPSRLVRARAPSRAWPPVDECCRSAPRRGASSLALVGLPPKRRRLLPSAAQLASVSPVRVCRTGATARHAHIPAGHPDQQHDRRAEHHSGNRSISG